MKIELTALDRAYIANQLRQRVIDISASVLRRDATRGPEFTKEAEYAESLAVRLDDGRDAPDAKGQDSIVVEERRDIDYIDPIIKETSATKPKVMKGDLGPKELLE